MSDPIEAGIQRQVQEVLAAALRRIPPDGRWVVLQGDLAKALLPHLGLGAGGHPPPALDGAGAR